MKSRVYLKVCPHCTNVFSVTIMTKSKTVCSACKRNPFALATLMYRGIKSQ